MNGRAAMGPKVTVITVFTRREMFCLEMKFCTVFLIDLDSIIALNFFLVDTVKEEKSVYCISILLPASSVLQPEGSPQPAEIFGNVGNGQDSPCRFSCQTNI